MLILFIDSEMVSNQLRFKFIPALRMSMHQNKEKQIKEVRTIIGLTLRRMLFTHSVWLEKHK